MIAFDSAAVLSALPDSRNWTFGGHPYGLEPLALPDHWLSPTAVESHRFGLVRSVLETIRDGRGLPAGEAAAMVAGSAPEIDRVFWFRWITGHQATFALWQLLGATLGAVPEDRPGDPRDLETLAATAQRLVRAYSLMLLYSASVTREIYGRVIRPSLARHHPNLSGAWARDYGPVRRLLRDRVDFGDGPEAEALRQECAVNEAVHEGISVKLVSSGISLLQAGNVNRGRHRMTRENLQWLYDGIFLTSRMPVSYSLVVRQLTRRLHAVYLDLAVNGLYPEFASSEDEQPPLLRTAAVAHRTQTSAETLLETIDLAGRLAESPLAECPMTEAPLTEVPLTEVPLTEVPLSEVPLSEVH
jgi:L-tyrosine peroxygenase